MVHFFESYPQQLVAWIAILAILVVTGVYVVGKIRAGSIQQEPVAGEMLAKFRELHSQGVLSDAEFRTIKTTLAVEVQRELKGKDETG